MTEATFKKQARQQDEKSLAGILCTILVLCMQKEGTLAKIVEKTKMKPAKLREYLTILLNYGLISPLEEKPTCKYRTTSKGEEFLRRNLALFKGRKRSETKSKMTEEKTPETCIDKNVEENLAEHETEITRNESITDNVEEILAKYELKEEQPPWAEANVQNKISPQPASKAETAPSTTTKTRVTGLSETLKDST